MGVLPLQFIDDMNRKNLKLNGSELISILGLEKGINPGDYLEAEIKYSTGDIKKIRLLFKNNFSENHLIVFGANTVK